MHMKAVAHYQLTNDQPVPEQRPTVLGLARTGLIFTRNQEGTQPGGLTHPGQTEQGTRHRLPPCWVRGAGRGESSPGSGTRGAPAVRAALCVSLFVLCILLISTVVVTVCFVCCSVKLPLSRPTSFLPFSFHSPSHPSGGGGVIE